MKKLILLIISCPFIYSQNINLNNNFVYDDLRFKYLNNDIETTFSMNVRPIDYDAIKDANINFLTYRPKKLFSNKKESIQIKFLGIDYFTEYNSLVPYNRNNGSMIPNRGYQHIISPGLFFKFGPLSIKLKPENHFSQNLSFDGFWEGHYPVIWSKRYKLWNHVDIPERFGQKRHNNNLIGQSNIKLSWKKISIGFSTENIWWGPSIRNSIMMSNHARGFKHLFFNSNKPVTTPIGNFEWQIITGRLEASGYTPPRTDFEYAGTRLYVRKINQLNNPNDWRYLQGYIISFSPKLIDGLSIGFIRWVQMYSALLEGKYWWLKGSPTYFPAFKNLFRKSDVYENYEAQTDQAAGIFLKWLWKDSKAEFYAEFHHNDSKQNIRDLILDSDHSRAVTLGFQKIFRLKNSNYLFNWEWTQMEQTASRLLRNAGSWYEHRWVYHGYTNYGEVLGSGIGPGSNSQYFSINKINERERIGLGFEIIDQDNDFYHLAFASAQDFRRYWKDFNLHLNYSKSLRSFNISSNFVYSRSLNYQWELDDYAEPYFHAGKDINNFHLTLKVTYFGNW